LDAEVAEFGTLRNRIGSIVSAAGEQPVEVIRAMRQLPGAGTSFVHRLRGWTLHEGVRAVVDVGDGGHTCRSRAGYWPAETIRCADQAKVRSSVTDPVGCGR
jgi:hypothetical protein